MIGERIARPGEVGHVTERGRYMPGQCSSAAIRGPRFRVMHMIGEISQASRLASLKPCGVSGALSWLQGKTEMPRRASFRASGQSFDMRLSPSAPSGANLVEFRTGWG